MLKPGRAASMATGPANFGPQEAGGGDDLGAFQRVAAGEGIVEAALVGSALAVAAVAVGGKDLLSPAGQVFPVRLRAGEAGHSGQRQHNGGGRDEGSHDRPSKR